ncbi:MAG: hypothetical protein QOI37_1342, partial [Chloroflexota bacterium]|nr:hypothetical protein [Chloroflexota bacterium]
RVEPGDTARANAGRGCERADRLGQGRLGIADVGPETDVGADPWLGHRPSMGGSSGHDRPRD